MELVLLRGDCLVIVAYSAIRGGDEEAQDFIIIFWISRPDNDVILSYTLIVAISCDRGQHLWLKTHGFEDAGILAESCTFILTRFSFYKCSSQWEL